MADQGDKQVIQERLLAEGKRRYERRAERLDPAEPPREIFVAYFILGG